MRGGGAETSNENTKEATAETPGRLTLTSFAPSRPGPSDTTAVTTVTAVPPRPTYAVWVLRNLNRIVFTRSSTAGSGDFAAIWLSRSVIVTSLLVTTMTSVVDSC